ncbi:MAG: DUF4136 domain-containing protein [Cryomorphaceae bacterium]|nr:MAG: DUF4136 domain-containing protein [Cryomorphaceae bacterium]
MRSFHEKKTYLQPEPSANLIGFMSNSNLTMMPLNPVLRFGAFAFVLLSLVACRPAPNDFVDDFDLVYTSYDVNYNFSVKSTFALPDSVLVIGEGEPDNNLHKFDDLILEALSRHMINLGWERVSPDSSQLADLVMLPMISATEYSSCFMPCWDCGWGYWGGWDYYPGGWGGGWGWYYPPSMACSDFRTGTLFVTLSDPNNANNLAEEIPVAWKGVVNGFLQGSDASIATRLEVNLSQMFSQSQVLKK